MPSVVKPWYIFDIWEENSVLFESSNNSDSNNLAILCNSHFLVHEYENTDWVSSVNDRIVINMDVHTHALKMMIKLIIRKEMTLKLKVILNKIAGYYKIYFIIKESLGICCFLYRNLGRIYLSICCQLKSFYKKCMLFN